MHGCNGHAARAALTGRSRLARRAILAKLVGPALLAVWHPVAGAAVLFESDFSAFAGAGLAPGTVAGTLDSRRWSLSGLSDGESTPGDTWLAGDFARGRSTGGVGTGGLYAFEIPGAAAGRAPGVQPTGTDLTPGALVLSLENTLGVALAALDVSFDLLVRNDAGRSTRVGVDLSLGGPWTPLPALFFATPPAADADPAWRASSLGAFRSGLAIAPGAPVSLRWRFMDGTGSGGRDEVALDRIRVSGVAVSPTEPPAAVGEAGTLSLAAVGFAGMGLAALRPRRARALRIVNPRESRA